MQRRTVTKFAKALWVAGAVALVGCQAPVSDDTFDQDRSDRSANAAPVLDVGHPKALPGEYIVVFRDELSAAAAGDAVRRMRGTGAALRTPYSVIPAVAGRFNDAQLAALRNDPDVAYIEANKYVTTATVYSGAPYGLDRIDSRTGTDGRYDDFGFNGSGIHIYILDTGIRTAHHEFIGRIGTGFSAIDGSPSVEDCNGHGTHVASIAAGTQFGVAKGAIVHSVRAMDCTGNGTTADVIEGLNWVMATATTFPAVVNMSIFGPASPVLNEAVRSVNAANIPVVVAAGNFGIDACLGSPASAPSALTVGATANGEARASFSNVGNCIDLFAPGVGVLGAGIANNDATATADGTSESAPFVTGAVALYMQRFPRNLAAKVNGGVAGNSTPGVVTDTQGAPSLLLFTDFHLPAQQSCFGRCGGQSPDFSCACDDLCAQFEDCCADKGLFCH